MLRISVAALYRSWVAIIASAFTNLLVAHPPEHFEFRLAGLAGFQIDHHTTAVKGVRITSIQRRRNLSQHGLLVLFHTDLMAVVGNSNQIRVRILLHVFA